MNEPVIISINIGKVAIVDQDDAEMVHSVCPWYVTATGYAAHSVRIRKGAGGWCGMKAVMMHHLVMDRLEGFQTDHINGNKLDNRKSNLRIVTIRQNQTNRPKFSGTYSSKFKGVSYHAPNRKWQARITHMGKGFYIGCFPDEISAALAYDRMASALHGEYARLNLRLEE